MRSITRIAISLLLVLGMTASAEFVTVEEAYEVPLNRFRMAGTSAGALAFKQCEDCDIRILRVTGSTEYVFQNERMELVEFRKALIRVNRRANKWVIILHHLESDVVTRVTLNF